MDWKIQLYVHFESVNGKVRIYHCSVGALQDVSRKKNAMVIMAVYTNNKVKT